MKPNTSVTSDQYQQVAADYPNSFNKTPKDELNMHSNYVDLGEYYEGLRQTRAKVQGTRWKKKLGEKVGKDAQNVAKVRFVDYVEHGGRLEYDKLRKLNN